MDCLAIVLLLLVLRCQTVSEQGYPVQVHSTCTTDFSNTRNKSRHATVLLGSSVYILCQFAQLLTLMDIRDLLVLLGLCALCELLVNYHKIAWHSGCSSTA